MIDGLGPLGPMPAPPGAGPVRTPERVEGGRTFKEILKDSIESVNRLQKEADGVLEKYSLGQASEEQLLVAFKKSQIAFEALLQIRNKVVEAFEEIQRMRI
jgi:flagellar hook-basal body complex protein FliE